MLGTIYNYTVENWDQIVKIIGTASVLAAMFARLTRNKTDDRVVAFVQRVLDLIAVNPERKALQAGDDAVAANPPAGVGSVVGDPLDVE